MRRNGQKTTETVYLISSLTLEQLDALGWLKLKRGYWVIESRLHHALDVSLDEDRSRVRNPNAALILGMFRRLAGTIQLKSKCTIWSDCFCETKQVCRASIGGEPNGAAAN